VGSAAAAPLKLTLLITAVQIAERDWLLLKTDFMLAAESIYRDER
jgi:hypothetical protein